MLLEYKAVENNQRACKKKQVSFCDKIGEKSNVHSLYC
jgi:hypothetical protein